MIKMKKAFLLKRTLAVCAAAAVAAGSMSGCTSDTQYPLSVGGDKINPGIYINYILGEMGDKMYELYYAGGIETADDCFDKQIDGVSFAEAVKNDALKSTKEFVAINAKFDEFELSLSDDEWAEIDASVSNAWSTNGEMLEYIGVSRESYKQVAASSYKRHEIFEYYYGNDGKEPVSDEEVQSYVNDNYIRYKMITYPKSLNDDEALKEQENKESEERFQHYLEEAQGLSFEEFDRIIDEHNEYLEQLEAEANEEAADEQETPESETAADDSSETEAEESSSDIQDEDSSEAADADASSVSSDAEAEDDTPAEEDASSDEEGEDAAEEDPEAEPEEEESDEHEHEHEHENPYANESILNATKTVDPEGDSYNENYAKMIEAVMKQPKGVAAYYGENENYYVLFITADVSERTDYTEDNRETLVHEIKDADFDLLVSSWAESLDISVNDKAIKKYGVKVLFDRQNKYYSKNGGAA